MFGPSIDPDHMGDPLRVGYDSIDFLGGQVGGRSYEDQQKLPGDFEAITSQGRIASHADENPLSGDVGVYAFRKILRAAITGENSAAAPSLMHSEPKSYFQTYTQNTILNIPQRPDTAEDKTHIRSLNNQIVALMDSAQGMTGEREQFVRAGLANIEAASARKDSQ
jgi:hypothetical protein